MKQSKIAKERIEILFNKAKQVFNKSHSLANRYITLARKLAMKTKTKIPRKYKRLFCKHCYKFMMPGVTCRVRTQKGKVVYYCLNCKKYTRIRYK